VVRSPSFTVEYDDDVDYDVKVGVIEDTLRLLNFGYIIAVFCSRDIIQILLMLRFVMCSYNCSTRIY